MQPPHCFPSLVGPGEATRPLLIIGAGMSCGIVPTPSDLCESVKRAQAQLETSLGCNTKYKFSTTTKPEELYAWAGLVMQQLTAAQLSKPEAKHKLADAIGVTRNPRFRAYVDIPLRGSTPRHRVVARFAREGRWKAIWSLNWDVVQESALRSVGLMPHANTSPTPKLPQQWPEWYSTWTQPDPYNSHSDKTLMVIKPHGCVEKLLAGSPTFLVTDTELNTIGTEMNPHHARLHAQCCDVPLIAAGWSASEQYIHETLQSAAQAGTLGVPGSADTLSIIDPAPNNAGHLKLASAYQVDPKSAEVLVHFTSCYTTDDLFLWMQTRYGLFSLVRLFGGVEKNVTSGLATIVAQFDKPNCNNWVNAWFDDFLPVWVRLCFNTGVVEFRNGPPIDAATVPTHRRDEHIPWGDRSVDRPELRAAAQLLLALWKRGSAREFDCSEFPGGFWDMGSRHLIIPLPVWNTVRPLSLAALKPLAEGRHWSRRGKIKRVSILPLSTDGGKVVLASEIEQTCKQQVARLMSTARLAQADNVNLVDLETLRNTP